MRQGIAPRLSQWQRAGLACCSISFGWSPTGTFVTPGVSTSVKFRTCHIAVSEASGRGVRTVIEKYLGRIHFEQNRVHRDALIGPADPVGLRLDLFENLLEIIVPLASAVRKLAISLRVVEQVQY